MTNTALLVEKIIGTGLKYAWIAKQLGLSYYGLRKKIDNVTEFKASEIDALCKVLNIQSAQEKELIFFSLNSDFKSLKTRRLSQQSSKTDCREIRKGIQ